MIRKNSRLFGGILAVFLIAGVAEVNAAKREDVDFYKWSIRGIYVTATAAELNQLHDGDFTINNATVRTNATVGGTLGVTGVATFTATPVCKDGLTIGTNVTISSLTAGSPVFASGAKVLTTSGLISNANVAAGLDSSKLLAGSVASAFDGSAVTNIPTGGMNIPANSRTFLDSLNFADMRTNLDLEIGIDVQAYDVDLDTWATVTPSANGQSLVAVNYDTMKTNLNLEIGIDVQAYDADLDTWATVTPSANGQAFVAAADYAAMRTNLLETATLYSGTYTNLSTLSTNTITVLNGVIVSVTLDP